MYKMNNKTIFSKGKLIAYIKKKGEINYETDGRRNNQESNILFDTKWMDN